ncbi:hypothetical protein [Lactococcus fujiensis]|uniref:hypothetical protein n=1 Tax=Lactococcus fujiensis TaxID=610251 RepID=UPI0006D2750D|nr:hypothetical protein [Lactococcus fujiensis]
MDETNKIWLALSKVERRYNIKIYLNGIPDLILLKFHNKVLARTAYELLRNSQINSKVVDIVDDYGKVSIRGDSVAYLYLSEVVPEVDPS